MFGDINTYALWAVSWSGATAAKPGTTVPDCVSTFVSVTSSDYF